MFLAYCIFRWIFFLGHLTSGTVAYLSSPRTWSSYTKTFKNLICNFPVFVVKKLIRGGTACNLWDKGEKNRWVSVGRVGRNKEW